MKKKGKSLKTLRNKCDRLVQEWGRDKYSRCLVCGKPISCLHHYYPKSVSSVLRYNENNLIPICQGCHLMHHNGDPRIHARILEIKGIDWHKELTKKKEQIIKINQGYYKKIIEKYATD